MRHLNNIWTSLSFIPVIQSEIAIKRGLLHNKMLALILHTSLNHLSLNYSMGGDALKNK